MRVFLFLPLLAQAQINPHQSAADIELGRKIYAGRCGHCHGQNGEGGRGAALNSGQFRHGGSDRELFLVIRNGIPNSEMPPGFGFPDIEVWRMVAYVKQLARGGAPDVAIGDPKAGAAVYRANGCAQCHTIEGEGGFLGPDLTNIGAKRAVRHLRESILKPDADLPLDYRLVVVVTRDGKSISGIHLNEDEYSVHLRDTAGNIRSFLKSELKEVKLPKLSFMPAYPSLSTADLENLVAYLSRLGTSIVWNFDRLDSIGGHRTAVLGEPKIIISPLGIAVEFDGVDDALFIDNHPLAGAETFTFEAIFRPDGGAIEQRWFHLNEVDPKTGADADNRMLFEIRVTGDKWFLDCFNQSGVESKALMNRAALHPLGAWHYVACVYDGKYLASYVNGIEQMRAPIRLAPHGPGRASVGVRINKVFYFKGAVHLARFTRRALATTDFLRIQAPNR